MPHFAYTCIDARTGRETKGRLESLNKEQAVLLLKGRGLHPVSLVVAEAPVAAAAARVSTEWWRVRPIDRKAITHFTRQLAALVKAGMPLLRSLEVLARQTRNPRQRALVASLAEAIRGGGTLSEAMAARPEVFTPLYLAMIKAGEAGGVLEVVLDRLGRFMEKSDKLRNRVQAALVYPMMIALVAGGIVAALMAFVVPKFELVFASLLKGQRMPALTEAVLAVGDFVQAHVWWVGLTPLVAVVVWWRLVRVPSVRRLRDRMVLALPGFGGLILRSAVARLTRTLGTLLAAGVPILPALLITRETAGNTRVAAAITSVHDGVQAGESVAAPLAATGVFPELVPSMIEVGEETGALPEMLNRIADTFDDEVDAAVAGLTSLIEPATIAVMAVVVGTIVIAMFLPIVRIIQTLS